MEENLKKINAVLGNKAQLIVVSKTHSVEKILEVYHFGERKFGENKVQELVEKYEQLPKDIQWHLIGHLQTNKVKLIAPFVEMIQSVDSQKLLLEIDKQALKNNRKIKILLQVKIAEEDSKTGFGKNEFALIFQKKIKGEFPNIEIKGLMGIATFTADQSVVRKEFLQLKEIFDETSSTFPIEILSMGMSDDYELALECGSNLVRIGSGIFGRRNYNS